MAPRQSYTHKKLRAPTQARNLMRWTPDKHDELLLCIERVLCDRGMTDVLDDAGQLMSGPAHPTVSAIHQHFIKLRADRELSGLPCVTKHSTRKQKKPVTPLQQLPQQFPPPLPYGNDFSTLTTPYPAIEQKYDYGFMAPPFPEMQQGTKRRMIESYEDIDDYLDPTPTKQQKYFTPPIPQSIPTFSPISGNNWAIPPPDDTLDPAQLAWSYPNDSIPNGLPPMAPGAPREETLDSFDEYFHDFEGGGFEIDEYGMPKGDFTLGDSEN